MFHLPAPPAQYYSAASVRQHKVGQVCLSTISDGRRINAITIKDHRVFLVKTDTVCNSTWEGQKLAPVAYTAGEVAFIPGNTEVSSIATTPYEAASVELEDSWLRENVLGDVDYNQIDFRFGKLRKGPAGHIVGTIMSLTDTPDFHWPALIEGLTVSLAASVVAGLSMSASPMFKAKSGLTRERKARVLDYIEAHYREGHIELKEMAAIASLSVFHFARAFRNTLGVSPVRYVAERRVKHAQQLLRTTSNSLSAIGYACGFASQSHFNTAFRATTGISPGVWRLRERVA